MVSGRSKAKEIKRTYDGKREEVLTMEGQAELRSEELSQPLLPRADIIRESPIKEDEMG